MEQPGRRVTSKDVALAAGVSRQTVSNVLNGVAPAMVTQATRERVLRLAAEMGYVPYAAARQLRGRRAHSIGLSLTSPAHYIASSFSFVEFFKGICDVVERRGYDLTICPSGSAEHALAVLKEGRVDGLLIMYPLQDDPSLVELAVQRAPAVALNRLPEGVNLSWVDIDNQLVVRSAVTHLLDAGYERIGFLAGWEKLAVTWRRVEGYRQGYAAGTHRG